MIATWTLILYVYAGLWANGDSVSLQTVTGFSSEQACVRAGVQSTPLVKGSAKEIRFVCVEVK